MKSCLPAEVPQSGTKEGARIKLYKKNQFLDSLIPNGTKEKMVIISFVAGYLHTLNYETRLETKNFRFEDSFVIQSLTELSRSQS